MELDKQPRVDLPATETPCNSVFINLMRTLDDFEAKRLIESNTSLKIAASDAYMQKIINHCSSGASTAAEPSQIPSRGRSSRPVRRSRRLSRCTGHRFLAQLPCLSFQGCDPHPDPAVTLSERIESGAGPVKW